MAAVLLLILLRLVFVGEKESDEVNLTHRVTNILIGKFCALNRRKEG